MPYPVECLLEVNEDMIEVLLVLEVLLAQYPKVEDLLCCAASMTCFYMQLTNFVSNAENNIYITLVRLGVHILGMSL